MNNLYQRIQQGIQCLPRKDKELCEKFLKQRNFEGILEIAQSDLTMKNRDSLKETPFSKWKDVDAGKLQELVYNTMEYLTYLDIPDDSYCDDDLYY